MYGEQPITNCTFCLNLVYKSCKRTLNFDNNNIYEGYRKTGCEKKRGKEIYIGEKF